MKKQLQEIIEIPEGGYTDTWLFDKMQKGEKDILFIVLKHPGIDTQEASEILTKAKELGYGELKVDKKDGEASIIYRPTSVAKNKAKRLLAIANKHGGYLSDKTPEEAREIGTLLDYSPKSIDKYISRVYKTQESIIREIIRDEIKNVLEEATFIATYNGPQGVFAHEFKAKDEKDIIEKMVRIYRIPGSEIKNVKIKKTSSGLFSLIR